VSLRIVLYVEGHGESAGVVSLLPPPGAPLQDIHLGPAHALVRRCVARETGLPDGALSFLSPLRLATGRHHRGSDLLHRQTLRQLLTWLKPQERPNLAVVLADADGKTDRRSLLYKSVDGIRLPHVIGVAVQEFESWLIADHRAVVGAVKPAPHQPPSIEHLDPRKAKSLLEEWTSSSRADVNPAEIRLTLAQTADLTVLDQLSAFQSFRDDLRAAISLFQKK
jgi:hypothetical protein